MNWLEISQSTDDFFVFEAPSLGQKRFVAALGEFEILTQSDLMSGAVPGPLLFKRGFGLAQPLVILRPKRFESLDLSFKPSADSMAKITRLRFKHHARSSDQFLEKVKHVQELQSTGQLVKAVPVEIFKGQLSSDLSRADWVGLMAHVAAGHHAGFFYASSVGGEITLGCSPELLFWGEQHGSVFDGQTMALAGTFLSDVDATFALGSQKESYEHKSVVQDLSNKLTAVGASVSLGERTVFYGSKLAHLKTSIAFSGALNWTDLIEALHPTAALGVYPSTKANLSFLDNTLRKPLLPTSQFGAPIGFVDERGFAMALVAIRNLQVCGTQAQVVAGAGITRESVPELEYKELMLKVSSTLASLGIQEVAV